MFAEIFVGTLSLSKIRDENASRVVFAYLYPVITVIKYDR